MEHNIIRVFRNSPHLNCESDACWMNGLFPCYSIIDFYCSGKGCGVEISMKMLVLLPGKLYFECTHLDRILNVFSNIESGTVQGQIPFG